MDYRSIITIEPGKHGAKPCIRGMRITPIFLIFRAKTFWLVWRMLRRESVP